MHIRGSCRFPTSCPLSGHTRPKCRYCTLLVDTYDVEQGVRNAIIVARELERDGHKLQAIRIDSGDLAWLSKMARSMLDKAGLFDVGIVLSNDLDEYTIMSLNDQKAQYTALGVGTHLAAAYGQPALGGVYKLSAIREPGQEEWTPRLKISEQLYKRTIPGVLDVRRYFDADGHLAAISSLTCTPSCPQKVSW